MPVPQPAYGGVWLYLEEACSRDDDAVPRYIAFSMDNLEGAEWRGALRQLYINGANATTEPAKTLSIIQ